MKKRLIYVVVAFMMVGVNLGGIVQAFADGGEEPNANNGVVENASEGGVAELSGARETTGSEIETEGAAQTQVELAAEGGENAIGIAEGEGQVLAANVLAKNDSGSMLGAAALSATEPDMGEPVVLRAAPVPGSDDNRFLAEVGDIVELNIEGLADGSQRSCRVNNVIGGSEEVGATCGRTDGKVEVSKVGMYDAQYDWRICSRWNSSHTACRQYENKSYSATIVVYDVAADLGDGVLSEEDMVMVTNFVTEQIRELLGAGEAWNQYVELDDWDSIWSMLANDPHFAVKAVVGDDRFGEASDEVAAEMKDSEEVAIAYGGYIYVYIGDEEVGMVYELTTPVTMQLEIPEEYVEAPAGYTRVFSMIRGHEAMDGVASATRMDITRDGNSLGFENDKFSSFVIVYEDVADESTTSTAAIVAPNTGAMMRENNSANSDLALAVFAGLVAVLTFGAVKFAKRH